MSFFELGLSEELVRAVSDHGYTVPTPIQQEAIPVVLAGRDVLGGAQTGTGKTAAFVLPILERLGRSKAHDKPRRRAAPRVLIVVPTRELAAQVEESVRTYGKYTGLQSLAVFGGVNINPQIQRLARGVDLVIATPGRLLDHVQQRTIDLSSVETLVLDEADRMLDMGFIHDIRRILKLLPQRRQNLLFSATFSDDIRALATGLLNQPATVQVATFRNAAAANVSHKVYHVARDRKRELLSHLIRERQWFQVLVFTRTKHGANRLSEQLNKDGIPSLAIHGNKSQGARTRALSEFKSGDLQVLVATDIAARGLDIVELPHVVNYDLPFVPEDYVHRIGRTGRAGSDGEASSLVSHEERGQLKDIERVIRLSIPVEVVPGFAQSKPTQSARMDHPPKRHDQPPGRRNDQAVQRPTSRATGNAGRPVFSSQRGVSRGSTQRGRGSSQRGGGRGR